MTLTVALRGDETLPDDEDVAAVPPDREPAADVLVAAGAQAFRSLAADPPSVPVLPVAADVGPHGVPPERLDAVLRSLAADPTAVDDTVAHPLLSVAVDGVRTRAVLDATLVTSEAARISEYAVAGVADSVSFRADGVVVATPLGSAGYGHAAGGPVLTAVGGIAVVPVSPYTTRPRTWVADLPLTVTVERDETPVSLVVDGTESRAVGVDDPVRLDRAGDVDLVRPPRGTGDARRLEKL
jgi:NAD+ kinase